ncbi:MAG: hypothetical protein V4555_07475 [Acidobacteriota bacterium]
MNAPHATTKRVSAELNVLPKPANWVRVSKERIVVGARVGTATACGVKVAAAAARSRVKTVVELRMP